MPLTYTTTARNRDVNTGKNVAQHTRTKSPRAPHSAGPQQTRLPRKHTIHANAYSGNETLVAAAASDQQRLHVDPALQIHEISGNGSPKATVPPDAPRNPTRENSPDRTAARSAQRTAPRSPKLNRTQCRIHARSLPPQPLHHASPITDNNSAAAFAQATPSAAHVRIPQRPIPRQDDRTNGPKPGREASAYRRQQLNRNEIATCRACLMATQLARPCLHMSDHYQKPKHSFQSSCTPAGHATLRTPSQLRRRTHPRQRRQ